MENSTPDPAACPTEPPLEQWAKDIRNTLHDIGTELGLAEGFEYSEILPAIRCLRSLCADSQDPS